MTSPGHGGEPATIRFSWTRVNAEQCPSEAEIAGVIAARLGRNPFHGSADRTLECEVRREGTTWRARIRELNGAGHLTGTRDLETTGPDCASLAEAATFAVLLTIDPEAAMSAEPSTNRAKAELEATPPATPLTSPPLWASAFDQQRHHNRSGGATPRVGAGEDLSKWRVALGVRGLVVAGVLPQVSGGVGIAADVAGDHRWHAELGAFWLPQVRTDGGQFSFGATVGWGGIGFDLLTSRATQLLTCVQMQAGAIHSAVYSLEPRNPGDHTWLAAAAGVRLRWFPVGAMTVDAGADGVMPVIRQEFIVRGRSDTVHELSAFGVQAFLGAGMKFD